MFEGLWHVLFLSYFLLFLGHLFILHWVDFIFTGSPFAFSLYIRPLLLSSYLWVYFHFLLVLGR